MNQKEMIASLKEQKILLGIPSRFPHAGILEVLCPGWDFVWLDAQHGQFDYLSLLNMIQVAQGMKIATVLRVPGSEPGILGAYADLAPDAIMIPMVENSAQAKELVKALRFPPLGGRSYGGERARSKVAGGMEHAKNLIIIAQIETPQGVKNVEEIVAIDGIDGLFLGAEDLKLQMGMDLSSTPATQPKLAEAMRKVVNASKNAKKFAGAVTKTAENIQIASEMGYLLLSCGGDSNLIKNGSQKTLELMKSVTT